MVHLVLIAVLTIVSSWPDTSFVHGLFSGFPAVGWIPPCGIWGYDDAVFLLSSMKPGKDDHVAAEAGAGDEAHGFCAAAFGWHELLQQNRRFRIVRRFVIQQSSGKMRVIDDAAVGKQSLFSHDSNKLRFCSAIQPCLHLQLLQAVLGHPSSWPDDVLSSGEDLPQAARKTPMKPEHTWSCVVAYHSPQSSAVQFRRYHSMLFGLPSAVTAFNRLSFFLQSMIRRLLVLASFYFGDLSYQDWASTAHSTQVAVQTFAKLCGYPLQASDQNDFLWGWFTIFLVCDHQESFVCGLVLGSLRKSLTSRCRLSLPSLSPQDWPVSCTDVSPSSIKAHLVELHDQG